MTRDDVLRIGRQAGAFIELAQEKDLLWLERFAALVAAEVMEEDAKVCDEKHDGFGGVAEGPFVTDFGKHTHMAMAAGAANCAAAIRARKPA